MSLPNEPAHFGRNVAAPFSSSFGRASIWVAFGAFALVLIGTAVVWISSSFGAWQQIGSILIMGLCLGFAPFAHIAGIVVGLIGLFRSGDNRMLAAIGIALNIAFIAFSGLSGTILSGLALSVRQQF